MASGIVHHLECSKVDRRVAVDSIHDLILYDVLEQPWILVCMKLLQTSLIWCRSRRYGIGWRETLFLWSFWQLSDASENHQSYQFIKLAQVLQTRVAWPPSVCVDTFLSFVCFCGIFFSEKWQKLAVKIEVGVWCSLDWNHCVFLGDWAQHQCQLEELPGIAVLVPHW